MRLDANGKRIETPSAEDVTGAIDNAGAETHGRDWYIRLDAGKGSIESSVQPDGSFDLLYIDKKRRMRAVDTLAAAQLKSIYTKFLTGEENWRDGVQWMREGKVHRANEVRSGPKDGFEPPTWAIATIVGSVAFVFAVFQLFGDYVPSGYGTYFAIGLIAFPMVMLLVVAAASKIYDQKRSANWSLAKGRVVTSSIAQHEIGVEDRKLVSVPHVEYEFDVNGKRWRGARIAIGSPMSLNMQETLQKYPVGAVVTVHYDPKNPNDCVLERNALSLDLPVGGCLKDAIKVAIVGGFILYMLNGGYDQFRQSLPNPQNAPLAMFAICFGIFALMFFYARRVAGQQASNWPSAPGRVMVSEVVEQRQSTGDRSQVFYKPVVEFIYPVDGLEYRSNQIKLGLEVRGTESSARKVCDAYPVGAKVEVHYDPANPGVAALENPTRYDWLMLAISLACFALAAYLALFARS